MTISKAFPFKPSKIYGVPNWRGLALFFILGSALYFSITHNTWVERWIFALMLLAITFHLLELNNQFRKMSYRLLVLTPPFADEEIDVPLVVKNEHATPSETLLFQFEGRKDWCECPPIPPGESKTVHLPFHTQVRGRQRLPVLRIRMKSVSNLFFLWQTAEAKEDLSVLPKALDHKMKASVASKSHEDYELSTIELIRDPRLLSRLDHKLLSKTGKPYMRTYKNTSPEKTTFLRWSDLKTIDEGSREEQFSYWVKYYQGLEHPHLEYLSVEAPFYTRQCEASHFPWVELRERFADWLDDKR